MARKRRSFPIPISTDYSKRAVAEQVLIDLVHKHPRGPNGTLTKSDYDYWGTDPELQSRQDNSTCGYKNIDLYRMVMNLSEVTDAHPTGEWDYRHLVRSIFPDCGERGVTRRSRRFAARLGRAVRRIQRQGLPGIWNVTWGYNDHQKAMMHADTEEDATRQAQIFFGPIIGEQSYRLSASFVREGSPLELLHANNKMLKGFDALVANQQERIKQAQQQIEEYETGKQFVEMYALNCMSAADTDGVEV